MTLCLYLFNDLSVIFQSVAGPEFDYGGCDFCQHGGGKKIIESV